MAKGGRRYPLVVYTRMMDRWWPAIFALGLALLGLAWAVRSYGYEEWRWLAFTSIGGLTVKAKNGFTGSLRYRFIDNRPANETNTVTAQGYFIADIIMSYHLRKFDFTISAENLLNTEWREAQFDTESRLRFEAQPVSEIHYTPGTPRFIKAGVTFYF